MGGTIPRPGGATRHVRLSSAHSETLTAGRSIDDIGMAAEAVHVECYDGEETLKPVVRAIVETALDRYEVRTARPPVRRSILSRCRHGREQRRCCESRQSCSALAVGRVDLGLNTERRVSVCRMAHPYMAVVDAAYPVGARNRGLARAALLVARLVGRAQLFPVSLVVGHSLVCNVHGAVCFRPASELTTKNQLIDLRPRHAEPTGNVGNCETCGHGHQATPVLRQGRRAGGPGPARVWR